MLILPIQEHGISLHLLVSSLISFISVLEFSAYRSFVSLGGFIPRYFILFVAMVNESVSIISLSDFSSLVYRNARAFCALILYPATLRNSLISSSRYFAGISRFLGPNFHLKSHYQCFYHKHSGALMHKYCHFFTHPCLHLRSRVSLFLHPLLWAGCEACFGQQKVMVCWFRAMASRGLACSCVLFWSPATAVRTSQASLLEGETWCGDEPHHPS